MPYDITTKDGITLSNIPDDLAPDAPQLRQLVQQRRTEIRQASPEFQSKVERQRASDAEQYDATKDMSWPEKAAANVGAGMSNLWTGAKDLLGQASDGEIQEKRRIDEHLKEKTAGGGALQLAGEIAPTLIMPAGAYLRTAQGAGNLLRGAVGMARVARIGAPAAARLGTGAALADSAIAGGVSGALRPTVDGESRLMNTALGATFGAALPMALGGARKGIEKLTTGGAARRVAEDMQDVVGPQGVSRAVSDLQAPLPNGAANVPVSSAGKLQNPELARMERTSRMDPREQPAWYDLDKRQAQESWNSVDRATQDAGELAKRQGDRSANWRANWANAEANTVPAVFGQRMGQLKTHLDQAARSPEAVNPLVLNALKQVDDSVMHFGSDFSPAHLQQLRAQLNGRPSLQPGATALQSAPRENAAIRSLIKELDDVLNDSTGGQWDKVRQGYTKDTADVHASKAAQIVRDKFVDDSTGRVQSAGSKFGADLPEVTPTGIGRAMDAARMKDKSLALSSGANEQLMNLQEALRKQAITQGIARSATAGGGSNTAGDMAGAAALHMAPSITAQALGAVSQGIKNIGQRKYNEQLAEALRNPDAMAKMLSTKLARDIPLSRSEELLLNVLRGSTGTAGAHSMPQSMPVMPAR